MVGQGRTKARMFSANRQGGNEKHTKPHHPRERGCLEVNYSNTVNESLFFGFCPLVVRNRRDFNRITAVDDFNCEFVVFVTVLAHFLVANKLNFKRECEAVFCGNINCSLQVFLLVLIGNPPCKAAAIIKVSDFNGCGWAESLLGWNIIVRGTDNSISCVKCSLFCTESVSNDKPSWLVGYFSLQAAYKSLGFVSQWYGRVINLIFVRQSLISIVVRVSRTNYPLDNEYMNDLVEVVNRGIEIVERGRKVESYAC